jgi:phosphoenolpyruvate carboxykinase (ATP)
LLADKMKQHKPNVWLVNTGRSGRPYGEGDRMKLSITRAIIDAIHSRRLVDAPVASDPVFGLAVITACPNVPHEVLLPRDTWSDQSAYDATAAKLAGLFAKNFAAYEAGVDANVRTAGPRIS